MFEFLTPYSLVPPQHPLFRLELQRIRWLASKRSINRSTLKVILIVSVILTGLWMGSVFGGTRYLSNDLISVRSGNALGWMLFASIAANVILDFACLIVTVNSFAAEITARRWDLLRLTPLDSSAILAVKHTAAQLRVWRLMVAILASRLIVVLLGGLTILASVRAAEWGTEGLLQLLILLVFAVIYVIEPFWRMRGVSALGLAIASRVRNIVSITLSAMGAVFLLWLTQAIIMGLIFWLMFLFLRDISALFTGYCVVLSFCLFTAGVIYGYYRRLRNSSLNYVMRRVDVLTT